MSLQSFVDELRRCGEIAVQPRLGFSDPAAMRAALDAVRRATAWTIGTITVDSFTRQGEHGHVQAAIAAGTPLNGFPLVDIDSAVTNGVLAGIMSDTFPIQVRHGTAQPARIFRAAADARIDAIEGGPISYGLVYGRTPLKTALREWAESAEWWAQSPAGSQGDAHIESFAGSLLGQMCPHGLHHAISIVEGMFFREHGITSLSLSCGQGTNPEQDTGAVLALRELAARYLADVRTHVVFYHFMGLFPQTAQGAIRLAEAGTRSATVGGASRIIVKTVAEAYRIPTLSDNVEALRRARSCAADHRDERPSPNSLAWRDTIVDETEYILERVLNFSGTIDDVIGEAFDRGALDIPYCIHPDNRNLVRTTLDPASGTLAWADPGRVPIDASKAATRYVSVSASRLLEDLGYNRCSYDSGGHDVQRT